jgi:hypothetical protein
MTIKYHKTKGNSIIAELINDKLIITGVQDALDLMGNLGSSDCNKIIIQEQNLHKDFFDLKTRFAGEILQKFSNYGVKLAVIGDFSKYKSKSLQAFIRECNRGNMIYFLDNLESALTRLENK